MKKLKVIVGIDKSKIIKSDKRIVACGKNFENVLKSSPDVRKVVVSKFASLIKTPEGCKQIINNLI